MAYLPAEVLRMEQKNMRISAIVTTLILVVMALLTFFFNAYRTVAPPPGKKYQMVGAIDFGDNRQGSRQVNNLERSVPDPQPTPPAQSQPTPQPEPATPAPTPPPRVTQPEPRPVSEPTTPTPTPRPTPRPAEPTPTPPQPTPQPTTPTQPAPQPTQELDEDFTFPSGGGANQGNDPNSTGNSGTPNTTVLDPNGLYSFGSGVGGSSGRGIVSLVDPEYNVQEEGVLRFEFYIEPDGSVSYAKALPNNKPSLAAAGERAIRKWRFTPAPGAGRQKVNVSITFKLRG